jgi:DNA-directed RNA polymerase subunit RPC12/RpoP
MNCIYCKKKHEISYLPSKNWSKCPHCGFDLKWLKELLQ